MVGHGELVDMGMAYFHSLDFAHTMLQVAKTVHQESHIDQNHRGMP